jgi:Xaa-Pro aminopeptidase
MDKYNPGWELSIIFSKLNQFYFTGTMQDAMLLIPNNGEAVLWVRRSYDRAVEESLFPNIKPMESYKDAATGTGKIPSTLYMETEIVPIAMLQRFKKYFPFNEVKPLDLQIGLTRSVKSAYEISLMEESGKIHKRVLEEIVPTILKEGMSEVELVTKIYSVLLEHGHQGVSRFSMFDTEMGIGQIGFGESSLYPTYFNGPGGNRGTNPAIPFIGSSERKLRKGDLVFVDIGCGFQGYHTDKTMTYMFGEKLPQEAIDIHKQCVKIQNRMAEMLKPGNIPSQIYDQIIGSLSPYFQENFMGYGNRKVKFLGHGIGLVIDEIPVIAKGFDDPLVEGIAFALEPKKGDKGVGMVGIENTFLVTPNGGRCITGTNPGLILVK